MIYTNDRERHFGAAAGHHGWARRLACKPVRFPITISGSDE